MSFCRLVLAIKTTSFLVLEVFCTLGEQWYHEVVYQVMVYRVSLFIWFYQHTSWYWFLLCMLFSVAIKVDELAHVTFLKAGLHNGIWALPALYCNQDNISYEVVTRWWSTAFALFYLIFTTYTLILISAFHVFDSWWVGEDFWTGYVSVEVFYSDHPNVSLLWASFILIICKFVYHGAIMHRLVCFFFLLPNYLSLCLLFTCTVQTLVSQSLFLWCGLVILPVYLLFWPKLFRFYHF